MGKLDRLRNTISMELTSTVNSLTRVHYPLQAILHFFKVKEKGGPMMIPLVGGAGGMLTLGHEDHEITKSNVESVIRTSRMAIALNEIVDVGIRDGQWDSTHAPFQIMNFLFESNILEESSISNDMKDVIRAGVQTTAYLEGLGTAALSRADSQKKQIFEEYRYMVNFVNTLLEYIAITGNTDLWDRFVEAGILPNVETTRSSNHVLMQILPDVVARTDRVIKKYSGGDFTSRDTAIDNIIANASSVFRKSRTYEGFKQWISVSKSDNSMYQDDLREINTDNAQYKLLQDTVQQYCSGLEISGDKSGELMNALYRRMHGNVPRDINDPTFKLALSVIRQSNFMATIGQFVDDLAGQKVDAIIESGAPDLQSGWWDAWKRILNYSETEKEVGNVPPRLVDYAYRVLVLIPYTILGVSFNSFLSDGRMAIWLRNFIKGKFLNKGLDIATRFTTYRERLAMLNSVEASS